MLPARHGNDPSAAPIASNFNFHFNWVAFEHRNPWLWYQNRQPYSSAGTELAAPGK